MQEQNLPDSIRALTEKGNRLRVEFLNGDLDLGFTFCETARIETLIDPVWSKYSNVQRIRNPR